MTRLIDFLPLWQLAVISEHLLTCKLQSRGEEPGLWTRHPAGVHPLAGSGVTTRSCLPRDRPFLCDVFSEILNHESST